MELQISRYTIWDSFFHNNNDYCPMVALRRQSSPKRFRRRSPSPASPRLSSGGRHGGTWEGRGGGRSSGRAGGRYGSPGGGRDGGRSNGRMREKLPGIFSIHNGEVVKVMIRKVGGVYLVLGICIYCNC